MEISSKKLNLFNCLKIKLKEFDKRKITQDLYDWDFVMDHLKENRK